MPRVKARADAVVRERARRASRSGCAAWRAARSSRGHARFEGQDRVRVGDELLTAPRIFINVGARPAVPDLPGVGTVPYLTNRTMLALDRVPRAPGGRRRQLHRPRVRADVPALRRERDRGREDAAPHRPRGRGRLRGDPGHPARPRASRSARAPSASAWRRTSAGVAVGVDCQRGRADRRRARTCCSRSAAGRTPTTSGSRRAGVATDARGYITVDDDARDQRARHLGARRLQRPRRLHAHGVQRLRDRRREPPRRRAAPR